MIRFDRSARSVVAVCRCGTRAVFVAGDGAAIDAWVAAHLVRAHPERAGDLAHDKAHDNALTAARNRRRYRAQGR